MKYIYHHLGLGDHIICNGLVRHFKEVHGEVTVFSKHHNFNNVNYMYRDDDNITVLSTGEDGDVNNYIAYHNINEDTIRIGFERLNDAVFVYKMGTFDECFYGLAEIPFEYRFSKFKFQRDYEKEQEVFEKYNPNNEKYIFLHGSIDLSKVRNDLKIIYNPEEYSIFHILKLIENAEEVHLMESSVKCLVNSFVFEKPKFYYHQYVRGYDGFLDSKGKNNFVTIY